MFKYLFLDTRYFGIVFNYLDPRLFSDKDFKVILKRMKDYTAKFDRKPEINDIKLLIDGDESLTIERTNDLISFLDRLNSAEVSNDLDLVMSETEEWVLHRSCELALTDSLDILQRGKPKAKMVELMKDAVSVSFSEDLGIEYIRDADKQYDFYTTPQQYLSCDIQALNHAWAGGLRKKALHLFIGGVNKGKSIFLAYLAGALQLQGYNVVLVSAEMSKEELRKRIDANVLDMYMDSLSVSLKEEEYFAKVKEIANRPNVGRLFIKDYPQGTANKIHLNRYLQDLKLKRHFKPDVLITDYLNEFASSRLPASAATDSYKYVKSVAGEQRALAFEWDMAVVSATQFNRKTADAAVEDVGMEGTAESFGVPAVADWMGAIVQDEKMRADNQYIVKNIKTRFGANLHQIYTLGVDRDKMRLFDVEPGQESIPVSLRDEMSYNDGLRKQLGRIKDADGDEMVWVFGNEVDD